jgi:hypothetical protein
LRQLVQLGKEDANMKIIEAAFFLPALAAVGVMPQTLYKSLDSDGRVIYSDKPVPGAVEMERTRSEPVDPESAARADAKRETLRQQAQEFQQRQRQRERALDAADAEVTAAFNALKQAEQRRETGVEPLPGERLGKIGGGSTLAPSYFERQQALDRDVSAAQQRLEEAYARRDEVR